MNYEVSLTASARREFLALAPSPQDRVAAAVTRLTQNPRPARSRKLAQREGWRLRVGDYRLLYTIDDHARTVTVFAIGHRRDVYR